jgi:hypothetical protein
MHKNCVCPTVKRLQWAVDCSVCNEMDRYGHTGAVCTFFSVDCGGPLTHMLVPMSIADIEGNLTPTVYHFSYCQAHTGQGRGHYEESQRTILGGSLG